MSIQNTNVRENMCESSCCRPSASEQKIRPYTTQIQPKNIDAYRTAARMTGIAITFFEEGEIFDSNLPELKVSTGCKGVLLDIKKDGDLRRFWEIYREEDSD